VQVDPIKPTFKAPGTKRLKLEFDKLLLTFAFKFNLRRYIELDISAAVHANRAAAYMKLKRWEVGS
jgi:hypothetical protein